MKSLYGYAVVDGSKIMVDKWSEQICIYLTKKDAEKSISDHWERKKNYHVEKVKIHASND